MPRLTARTFSCFQVLPEKALVHDVLVYQVEDARTRRLALELPRGTPDKLKIRGLGDTKVMEYIPETDKPDAPVRRWNVLLADASRGELRLAVDFEQPLPSSSQGKGRPSPSQDIAEVKDYPLPVVRAAGVAYQSGVVSVEGSAELDVQVKTDARRVNVGELTVAEYQPGCYLRGVFEQVGAPPAVTIDVTRPAGYRLPAAIVQRAEFFTLLSADGASQTQARFTLRSKALYLEVKLPEKAELWSAQLLAPGGGPEAHSIEAAARGRQPAHRLAGRRGRRRLPLAIDLRGPADDPAGDARHVAGACPAVAAAGRPSCRRKQRSALGRPPVEGPPAQRL